MKYNFHPEALEEYLSPNLLLRHFSSFFLPAALKG
jgi:hypothetical protein